MFRIPPQNKDDLANALEDKAKQLEKFIEQESSMPALRLLTEIEVKEIQDILRGVGLQAAPLNALLDRGIKDLEEHGMQFNPETQNIENIFATHSTDKVIEGVSKTDKSIFSPEENFGEVIKKGFGLDWKKDPDVVRADGTVTKGISGMRRQQACCEMVQQYEVDMKENKNVETEFLRDVIGLRTKHNAILGAAYDALDFLATSVDGKESEKNKEIAKGSAGGQLLSVILSLREAADSVRKINGYSHLMTAKEFQAVSVIQYFKRTPILKQIDHELKILQEPPSRLMFWKKQVVLSSDQRLAHLATLKSLVEDAKANPDVDKRRKTGLEKLLPQVDYAIQKTQSVQMREKQQRQQEKLASLKEPAPERQSTHRG